VTLRRAQGRPEQGQALTHVTAVDLELARKVLQTEAGAILALVERLDERFEHAVRLLLECCGRVIVTGMGKSGIICRKIAATLSSTGTPALFLHPAEAIHGDLGVIQSDDVVVALSRSGETEEILRLLETIKRLGARLIVITGETRSTLGTAADVALDCRVSKEACPLNLVPTASTTAALALGDALAMTLLVAKGFRQEDFAMLHPGGKLGKRLMRVEQLMSAGDDVPIVGSGTRMHDVMYEMSRKGLGMTCVVDGDGCLAGIITDGDLRRHMIKEANFLAGSAADVMTANPVTVRRDILAAEALHVLEQRKITSIVVVGERNEVQGVVHLHDLWGTELV
jgi:arabinose-5-phosphate isomerase